MCELILICLGTTLWPSQYIVTCAIEDRHPLLVLGSFFDLINITFLCNLLRNSYAKQFLK